MGGAMGRQVEELPDRVRRDRREVVSRLVELLSHLLKWEFQPDERSGSWRATIITQRQELGVILTQTPASAISA